MDYLIVALLIGIILYLVIKDKNIKKEDSKELITSMEKINSMQETA